MIRSFKQLWIALAAVVLLTATAGAQMPGPFAYIPEDVEYVARIDFQLMEKAPELTQVLASIQQKEPKYRAQIAFDSYKELAGNIPQLIEGFPGEILIMEAAGRDIMSQNGATYAVMYGRFNAPAIAAKLTELGWAAAENHKDTHIFVDPNRLVFLTMPNAWTIFLTKDEADIKRMIDIVAAPDSTPNLLRSGKPIAANAPAAARSYFFFNLGTSPGLMERLKGKVEEGIAMAAKQGQKLPPNAAEQAMTEITQMTQGVNSVLISLAENQGFRLNFALDFESEQSRNQVVLNLTRALSVAGTAMYSQSKGDPDVQALAQALQMAQFQTNGNRAYLSILIPPTALEKVANEIQKKQNETQNAGNSPTGGQ